MPSDSNTLSTICLMLTRAIGQTQTVDEIYGVALDALAEGLGVERASILLFDRDGVMRFTAWRGLSDAYRAAVEGHTPWTAETPDPQPLVIADVRRDAGLAPYLATVEREGIAAMTFIPLVSLDRVIGKFMLYFEAPHTPSDDDLQLARVIAAQVAFAVERTRREAQVRRSEERLRFALDAASMGTWDWDLVTDAVSWSDNVERLHGLPAGSFDGSFASYAREIHPDDRDRVLASARRALTEHVPHDVEYRIVAPDGTVRWCEGKGRVEYEGDRAVRMTGVCMMVTRRKEAELSRLAAAEDASRAKDEFLATLSHELRTPMHAILGWVQMLQQGVLSAERTEQAIAVIARNARLQAQLIEDVLDVSRIITGKLVVQRTPLAVPSLLGDVVDSVRPAAAARRITIAAAVASDLPPIDGDRQRLHQVLNNIIANAIKFTPEGGHVAIGCDVDAAWLRIVVCDSGEGIAPEFLPFIFDRFQQADGRPTRPHGGLGLGLAIARHLVEQHGGQIRAHSDGLGLGTTVTVLLPLRAEPPSLGDPVEPRAASEGSLAGHRVLVVDDQDDARELLSMLLTEWGAEVEACASADAAEAALAARPAQLIVADIAMPGVDGCQFLERVRARGNLVPAIAVTACARPEDRQRAMTAGYVGYCAKPIDTGELRHIVGALLRSTVG